MPKYRVLALSYINNALVQPGEVVEYDGKPGANLELMKGEKPWAPSADKRTPTPANDSKPPRGRRKNKADDASEDTEEPDGKSEGESDDGVI